MGLPLFFCHQDLLERTEILLDEDTSRHVGQVLRMQPGAPLLLTDGKGGLAHTTLTRVEKKKCFVVVESVARHAPRRPALQLCVAFTKNSSRNEWLLEKATELGVTGITPIIAHRSERERIRYDRWQNILIAALIQSQQYHLPLLQEALPLAEIIKQYQDIPQKLAGHCIESRPRTSLKSLMQPEQDTIVLIGPEGDFTEAEISACAEAGYQGMLLGPQRLRTETAAMAVCAYFNLINNEH